MESGTWKYAGGVRTTIQKEMNWCMQQITVPSTDPPVKVEVMVEEAEIEVGAELTESEKESLPRRCRRRTNEM